MLDMNLSLTSSSTCNDASWSLLSSSLGLGSSTVTSRNELLKYLDLESVSANDLINFDILAWWKKKRNDLSHSFNHGT